MAAVYSDSHLYFQLLDRQKVRGLWFKVSLAKKLVETKS
jgi:hypothetical protein